MPETSDIKEFYHRCFQAVKFYQREQSKSIIEITTYRKDIIYEKSQVEKMSYHSEQNIYHQRTTTLTDNILMQSKPRRLDIQILKQEPENDCFIQIAEMALNKRRRQQQEVKIIKKKSQNKSKYTHFIQHFIKKFRQNYKNHQILTDINDHLGIKGSLKAVKTFQNLLDLFMNLKETTSVWRTFSTMMRNMANQCKQQLEESDQILEKKLKRIIFLTKENDQSVLFNQVHGRNWKRKYTEYLKKKQNKRKQGKIKQDKIKQDKK